MPLDKREFNTLGGIPNTERQRDAAGSLRNSSAFNTSTDYSIGGDYATFTGIVAANPFIFDMKNSDLAVSDNFESLKSQKSGDHKVVYVCSEDKSPLVEQASEDLLKLPDDSPRKKLFLANLALGIGGSRIIVDASKLPQLPNRGDKVSFQGRKGDDAFPSSLIGIEQTSDQEIGNEESGTETSTKDKASEGVKVPQDKNQNPEEEGSDYNPDKNSPPPAASAPPSPNPFENKKKLKIVTLPADKVAGYDGYNKTSLREDAAFAYKKLYNEVKKLGGVLTSAGGYVIKGYKSFHSLGIAFDMSTATGFLNPKVDPYIMVKDPKRSDRYIVWCRTQNPNIPVRTFNAAYCKNKGLYFMDVEARAFNFTELAEKYGFARIGANSQFTDREDGKRDYMAVEWWHYQYTKNLIIGKSTWGEEVLKIVSEKEALKNYKYFQITRNFKYAGGYFRPDSEDSKLKIAELEKAAKEKAAAEKAAKELAKATTSKTTAKT